MQILERIKLIVGLILVFLVIFGTVFYFLISLKIINSDNYRTYFFSWTSGVDGASSNVPLFFGLCAIAACYLLANVRKKDI